MVVVLELVEVVVLVLELVLLVLVELVDVLLEPVVELEELVVSDGDSEVEVEVEGEGVVELEELVEEDGVELLELVVVVELEEVLDVELVPQVIGSVAATASVSCTPVAAMTACTTCVGVEPAGTGTMIVVPGSVTVQVLSADAAGSAAIPISTSRPATVARTVRSLRRRITAALLLGPSFRCALL